jgi:2-polyprenyl-3-methyl-5-hydroxy-6-metoxy-1,4-benzoquinol methylase
MADHPTCGLCGNTASSLVQRGIRYDAGTEVRQCAACGLVYLWPRPSQEELDTYYAEGYREEYDDGAMAERHTADTDEAGSRARRLRSLMQEAASLLEVGCGSGAFLEAVRPHVRQVAGIEPEGTSRRWLGQELGLQVSESLSDVETRGETYDVVVLFHVLEHIPDPVGFLKRLSTVLNPSGRLVIEVPNVDDALVSVYQIAAYREFYYQKAHLYYFSAATLEKVLAEAGLGGAAQGVQRYDLGNHLTWMMKGEPGGQGAYAKMLGNAVQAAYADALAGSGHSDTIWAEAWKAGASPDSP